ncbi:hypothetical protein ACP0AK_13900 [Listeria ivanovii]|uniref:Uncharacterized protein n=1 Tax=Listeria ivanovii (strain ATCC BAA-678 / PAM 55) TaxID=881621 RepID=G2ZBE6_LISIP|nr:hypothetical protein [Listeria ivanovii]AHI56276.1 hypothetical protein AX25_09350 [Listeria ivanovii WSLC3009]AIS65703.1 hypothetical protein JL52_09190 [Listeria ivanovii subsp. ivanovii]MBC1760687.1 hypothetical protein [Listeria ivanovii]MBK3915470.1 hypothetical protein [Listeria ivanovii subsp. ivanovii]MBK3922598.1 hypothetical protein [Listeria ivanovii subsp. ivanovii]
MKKWNSKAYQLVIISILAIAVIYFIINMVATGVGLEFSLLWHWVFIICFIFTTLANVKEKRAIGTAIGLSGILICVTSIVLMAI